MIEQNTPGQTGNNSQLVAVILAEIADRGGTIPFARFMELALYHPALGYYMAKTRRPGRGGDFITSPEATPLFGHALARQFAEFWERLGQPAQWSIREFGAGVGGLSYDIMAGLDVESPAAFEALTYHLAEINPAMRAEAGSSMTKAGLRRKIVVEDPSLSLPKISGAILGNEVADAFPVHRLVRSKADWMESMVAWSDDGFTWLPGSLTEDARVALADLEREGIEFPPGSIVDISPAAGRWFAGALSTLSRGYAMIIDYGYPARELFRSHRLQGTLRGYQGHTVTDDPLVRVGEQDLTAHVDFTALQRAGASVGFQMEGFTTQGALLSSLDLGDALLRLQSDPDATTEEYLATQAVVMRLIDPGGLGRFGVMIMSRGVAGDHRLRGFRDAPPSF